MRPIACLITDRSRLATPTIDGVVDQIRAAVAAGIALIQIRERDLEGRALYELASKAVGAVRGTITRIIVNDRLDVALAAMAHGIHLRGDSFHAERARAIAPPGFLIGRSVRSAQEAVAAGAVDYLQFGTVFETVSKPGVAAAGLTSLTDVVLATTLPVLAVGGLTRERVPLVCAAGAAGYAAIGMFADDQQDR